MKASSMLQLMVQWSTTMFLRSVLLSASSSPLPFIMPIPVCCGYWSPVRKRTKRTITLLPFTVTCRSARQMPSPGAVWPAIVVLAGIFIRLVRWMVPHTRNTMVRNGAAVADWLMA